MISKEVMKGTFILFAVTLGVSLFKEAWWIVALVLILMALGATFIWEEEHPKKP